MPRRRPFIEGTFKPQGGELTVGKDVLFTGPYDLMVQGGLVVWSSNVSYGFNVFPIKLDTGYGGGFHVSQAQVRSPSWANIAEEDLRPARHSPIPTRYANGQVEYLAPYLGDIFLMGSSGKEVCRIELSPGYTIAKQADDERELPDPDDGTTYTLAPLLGQRALDSVGAHLEVDFARHEFRLWIPKEFRETLD